MKFLHIINIYSKATKPKQNLCLSLPNTAVCAQHIKVLSIFTISYFIRIITNRLKQNFCLSLPNTAVCAQQNQSIKHI